MPPKGYRFTGSYLPGRRFPVIGKRAADISLKRKEI